MIASSAGIARRDPRKVVANREDDVTVAVGVADGMLESHVSLSGVYAPPVRLPGTAKKQGPRRQFNELVETPWRRVSPKQETIATSGVSDRTGDPSVSGEHQRIRRKGVATTCNVGASGQGLRGGNDSSVSTLLRHPKVGIAKTVVATLSGDEVVEGGLAPGETGSLLGNRSLTQRLRLAETPELAYTHN